jgi:hypothetical protein
MAEHKVNQDSPISNSLHPLVNMAIVGLVLMFVAAVWMFFDSDPYGGPIVVISLMGGSLFLVIRQNTSLARRCRKGAIHHITRSPRRRAQARWAALRSRVSLLDRQALASRRNAYPRENEQNSQSRIHQDPFAVRSPGHDTALRFKPHIWFRAI